MPKVNSWISRKDDESLAAIADLTAYESDYPYDNESLPLATPYEEAEEFAEDQESCADPGLELIAGLAQGGGISGSSLFPANPDVASLSYSESEEASPPEGGRREAFSASFHEGGSGEVSSREAEAISLFEGGRREADVSREAEELISDSEGGAAGFFERGPGGKLFFPKKSFLPESSPYRDRFTDAEWRLMAARSGLIAAGEISPYNRTYAEQLARSLDLPVEVCAVMPHRIALELSARQLAALPGVLERTAGDQAAMARAGQMASQLAAVAGAMAEAGLGSGISWDDPRQAWGMPADLRGTGLESVFKPVADTGRLLWNGTLGLAENVSSGLKGAYELMAGKKTDTIYDDVNKWLGQLKAEMPGSDNAVAQFGYDLAGNAPQLLGSLAAGMTLGPVWALGFMAHQIFGQSYRELRKKGVSPANAVVGAGINAGLQTPLERLGVAPLARFIKEGSFSLGRTMTASAAGEFITEALQTWPEYAGHLWAESSLYSDKLDERAEWFKDHALDAATLAAGVRQSLYEGALGGVSGGLLGGGIHIFRGQKLNALQEEYLAALREQARQNARAKLFDQAWDKASAELGQNQDPAGVAQLLRGIVPDEQVWISADDLGVVLNDQGEAGLSALGISREAALNAIQTGQPLAVDPAHALAFQGEAEGVVDKLRLEPDGPSREEARLFDAEARITQAMRMFLHQDEVTGENGQTVEEDIQNFEDDVRSMARELSRLKREMATCGLTAVETDNNARLLLSHVQAFAQTYGCDPAQMLANITVRMGEAENSPDASQDASRETGRREADSREADAETAQDADADAAGISEASNEIDSSSDNDLSTLPDQSGQTAGEENGSENGAEGASENGTDQGNGAGASGQDSEAGPGAEADSRAGQDSGLSDSEREEDPDINPEEEDGPIRGSVSLDMSRAIVRLFKRRNVATMPHELFHIFLRNLDVLASESGQTALRHVQTGLSEKASPHAQAEAELTLEEELARSGDISQALRAMLVRIREYRDVASAHFEKFSGLVSGYDELSAMEHEDEEVSQDQIADLSDQLDETGQEAARESQEDLSRQAEINRIKARLASQTVEFNDILAGEARTGVDAGEARELYGAEWDSLTDAEKSRQTAQTLLARLVYYNRLIRKIRRSLRQIANLDQARADLATMMSYSGLSDEQKEKLSAPASGRYGKADQSGQLAHGAGAGQNASYPAGRRPEAAPNSSREANGGLGGSESVANGFFGKGPGEKPVFPEKGFSPENSSPQNFYMRSGELEPGQAPYNADSGIDPNVLLQEEMAAQFTDWLYEGKAPSRALARVFARFSRWFTRLWADRMPQGTSPELAAVFGRLVASEREMQAYSLMRAMHAAETAFLESALLSDGDREKLRKAYEDIRAEFTLAYNSDAARRRQEWRKRRTQELKTGLSAQPFWKLAGKGGLNRAEATALIGEERVGQLAAKHPKLFAKEGGKSLEEAMYEQGEWIQTGDMLDELYTRLIVEGQTVSGEVKKLLEADSEAWDIRMAREARNSANEYYSRYLDKLDEALQVIIGKKAGLTDDKSRQRARNLHTPREIIANQAAAMSQNMKIRELTSQRFQAALDRALKERSEALQSNDLVRMQQAIFNARLAVEMMAEVNRARASLEASYELLNRIARAKPGTFPPLHSEALRRTLRFLTGQNLTSPIDKRYASFPLAQQVDMLLKDEDPGGYLPAFADWLLAEKLPKGQTGTSLNMTELTMSQLEDAMALVKWLQMDGSQLRRNARRSEAMHELEIANDCSGAMEALPERVVENPNSLTGKSKAFLRRLFASQDNLYAQALKADGLNNVDGNGLIGPFESLWRQALAGQEGKKAAMEKATAVLAPHIETLGKFMESMRKKYGQFVPGENGSPQKLPEAWARAYNEKHLTWDRLIAMALNCGNMSNLARLGMVYPQTVDESLAWLLGDEIAWRARAARLGDNEKIQAFLAQPHAQERKGLLTADAWTAIQGVWDGLGMLWNETVEAHVKMFGFAPHALDMANAGFMAQTQDGSAVWMSGGYYPVRYDPQVSDRVGAWSEAEDIMSRNDSLFRTVTAKKGHVIRRVDGIPNLPLLLNTSIIMEHLDDATSFIHLGHITRKMDRVSRNRRFARAYRSRYGREDYDAIRPNLRGLVRKEPFPKNDIVAIMANKVRRHLTIWGLGANLKVAALQMTAIFPAMGDVGVSHMLGALSHMAANPGLRHQIWKASPYLKSRLYNIDQDLRQGLDQLSLKPQASLNVAGRRITYEDAVNAMLFPIVGVDMMATSAVWLAAYNRKLGELSHNPHNTVYNRLRLGKEAFDFADPHFKECREYADIMVKRSNPDYDDISRSGFLRAQNAVRLVNGFASAITLFASRSSLMATARKKGKISSGRYLSFQFWDYIAPACGMFLFLALARGYLGGNDEPKDWVKLATGSLLDFYSMRLPIFGPLGQDALMRGLGLESSGRGGGLRTTLDAPLQIIDKTASALGGWGKEDQAQKLLMNALDMISFVSRMPISRIMSRAEAGYEQMSEGKGTPLSLVMPRPGHKPRKKGKVNVRAL